MCSTGAAEKERAADALFEVLRVSTAAAQASSVATLRILCGAAGTVGAQGSSWDTLRARIMSTRLAVPPDAAIGPRDAQAALCAGISACRDKSVVDQLAAPLLDVLHSTSVGGVTAVHMRLSQALVRQQQQLGGAASGGVLDAIKRWIRTNVGAIVALRSPFV